MESFLGYLRERNKENVFFKIRAYSSQQWYYGLALFFSLQDRSK